MAKTPRSPEAAAARRNKLLRYGGAATLLALVIVAAVVVPVTVLQRPRGTPIQLTSTSTNGTLEAAAGAATAAGGSSSGSAQGVTSNSSAGSSVPSAASRGGRAPSAGPSGYSAKKAPCNGINGLCDIPVRNVLFGGTHNSNAIKASPAVFENQDISFLAQLQQGVRLFDLDYSGRSNGRFAHCLDCFCGYAQDPADAAAATVFNTMGDFLAANPSDAIILGMSNIQCGAALGGIPAARDELLNILAGTKLFGYLATSQVQPSTRLGQLVQSNQRAILLFYDQWAGEDGYNVGDKYVPAQPFIRLYGGSTTVGGTGLEAISAAVTKPLTTDLTSQFTTQSAGSTGPLRVPLSIAGWFPSSCFACSTPQQCGPLNCALEVNREALATYLLGSATAAWVSSLGSSQQQLLPAFNAFQVDYWGQPAGQPGIADLVQRINTAWAWLYTEQPTAAGAGLGLANCVWLLDDAAYRGWLSCVHHGLVDMSAAVSSSRRLMVPANPQLSVSLLQGSTVVKTIQGSSEGVRVLPLPDAFGSMRVTWSQ